MNPELKQKLLQEVEKSGFGLELNVVEQLRSRCVLVYPNISFLDKSDKVHEMDALAWLENREKEEAWPHGFLCIKLCVECKSSKDRPWVFFKDVTELEMIMGNLLTNLEYISDVPARPGMLLAGCMNTQLRGHHYGDYDIPSGRTYFEAFGKDAGREIYEAVTNVWHSLDFCRRFHKDTLDAKNNEVRERRRTSFLQGVIVHRGVLAVASKQGDSFEISETSHFMLRTIDCITNKESPLEYARETIIDVVQEDYFETYLSLCEHDLSLCREHLIHVSNSGWLDS